MKRIAGIFNLDNLPVNSYELDRMLDAMKYHRHEAQSGWIDEGLGIGCTETASIVDEQQNPIPSYKAEQRCVIVFDGRIDNRRELLAALDPELLGCITDHELVLAAYRKWGLDFPGYLIGDYAFALWDKAEHCLVCARDQMGVKPFYYSFFQQTLVFASTPDAILASGKIPLALNEDRIADHLVNPLEGVDKRSTFYKDIFRLPPAHMLIVRSEGITTERYWELSINLPKLRTEAEYLDTFQHLFAESIRSRLQGVPMPASMLSGGMDSSSIIGMGRAAAATDRPQQLDVFAVISNSTDKNRETGYISSVLEQGGLRSYLISEVEIHNWMDRLVRAIENEMEPFDCLMNLNRSVYLQASEQKINAVLDGVDGDVLLSSSGYLIHLWLEGAYRTILDETIKANGLTAEYKMGRKELIGSFVSIISLLVPEWLLNIHRRILRQRRYRALIDTAVRETIINREFAIRSRLSDRFARLHSHSPRPRSLTQIEFHKITLNHPFLTVGLERYERVASQFGIEARHPFTDIRLVEFCLGLPWQLKTQRGWTKYILRKAMEPYLPSDVIWRRDKDSLMWEVNRLILKERAEYFHQATLDERETLKPYVDTQKLERFWKDYLVQGDEKHAEQLWSGIALAFWLRRHRNMVQSLQQGS